MPIIMPMFCNKNTFRVSEKDCFESWSRVEFNSGTMSTNAMYKNMPPAAKKIEKISWQCGNLRIFPSLRFYVKSKVYLQKCIHYQAPFLQGVCQ